MVDSTSTPEASGTGVPALSTAWRRHDELRAAAGRADVTTVALQAAFVTTTLLAAAVSVVAADGGPAVQLGLILLLVLAAILLAFAIRAAERDAAFLLRSGAAEIESNVFLFATLLQDHEERELWLRQRVRHIRRRVFERLGRELGDAPGPPAAATPRVRGDLAAEDYLRLRLDTESDRLTRRVRELELRRLRLQFAIFAVVVSALLLAAGGGALTVLVTLAAAVALALFAWSGWRRQSAEARRRREVAFALGQIRDYWIGLAVAEQSADRFMRLVIATEKVLRCLYDDSALSTRLAVAELSGDQEDLLERILRAPASAALDAALALQAEEERKPGGEPILDEPRDAVVTVPAGNGRAALKSPPHAFVVMPFGRKQSAAGEWIDFDLIYKDLIQPALQIAGFEPFRADEEKVSGDILTDMFQELLLADLVIADLSIDNANVFYELGVRHAMRRRGIIHIQAGRSYMPFDIFNVRTLPYHCNASGRPDPAHLAKDRQTIAQCAQETWASSKDRVHSPIYNLLDGLPEPDRRSLRTPLATGYWRQHNEWEQRMAVARRRESVGDLLLLTEEARNPLVQEEAIARAGLALRSLGLDELALQQYRRGLELNPYNRDFRREEAIHLGRLKRNEEAVIKLRRLLGDHADDIEALFALGEIYEDIWRGEFAHIDDEDERLAEAYQASDWLKKAIDTFRAAYGRDQNHAWSGTKAYILSVLLEHLAQRAGGADAELRQMEGDLQTLRGAVRFTLESRARHRAETFGALVRLGYLAICDDDDSKAVVRAFRKALTMAGKNRFYLSFTLERLRLFEALGFRPELTRAAIEVFSKDLAKMGLAITGVPITEARPPKVFLFEGLEIDHDGQAEARFPTEMEGEVRERLDDALERLGAGPRDLGITAGLASGGDMLFVEACLERQMQVRVHLPLAKAKFIERSVSYAGGQWVERFHRLFNHPGVRFLMQEDRVGPVPEGDDAYERSNRWALYTALGHGVDRLRLLLLWDGVLQEERGGAYHMLQQVQAHGGQCEILDTTKFTYWEHLTRELPVADLLAAAEEGRAAAS